MVAGMVLLCVCVRVGRRAHASAPRVPDRVRVCVCDGGVRWGGGGWGGVEGRGRRVYATKPTGRAVVEHVMQQTDRA